MGSVGLLRSIGFQDLDLILSWRNAPQVRKNMYSQHEITREEHLEWWRGIASSGDKKYFIYELNGAPHGVVGITDINQNHNTCSWAFYSSESAPRGIGSCMELLALEYIFYNLKIYKLNCEVFQFNAPVLRMHTKFGFIVEGVFQKGYLLDGERVDIVRLALFSNKWAEHRLDMIKSVERVMGAIYGK